MKIKTLIAISIVSILNQAYADTDFTGPSMEGVSTNIKNTADSTQDLAKYLKNLGLQLGNWDLNENIETTTRMSDASKQMDESGKASLNAVLSLLSSLSFPLYNSSSDSSNNSMLFVPTGSALATNINNKPNAAFLSYSNAVNPCVGTSSSDSSNCMGSSNSESKGNTGMNALEGVDVSEYASSPSGQVVQNILSYPPAESTCANGSDCTTLYTVLGIAGGLNYSDDILKATGNSTSGESTADTIKQAITSQMNQISNATNNKLYIPSLNADNLVNTLSYSTTPISGLSSPVSGSGLFATNQAGQADTFIRYVSGSLLPLAKPTQAEIKTVTDTVKTGSLDENKAAVAQVNAYITMLRTYAAQASVGSSNLYYLMGKRLPTKTLDDDNGDDAQKTSQAAEEFKLATSRLFPKGDNGKESNWMAQIKTASPADVQRQMAILLAEMNYQLYQNRMNQERMLMVLSVMQLQSLGSSRSLTTFSQAGTAVKPAA